MLSISEESVQEGWLLEALGKLEQEQSIVYEIDASELESACRG